MRGLLSAPSRALQLASTLGGAALLAAATAAATVFATGFIRQFLSRRVASWTSTLRDQKEDGSQESTASPADGVETDEQDDAPELEDLAEAEATHGVARPESWGQGQVLRPPRRELVGSAVGEASVASLPGRQRVFVKTYGCAHNSSDSEFMMGLLRDYGYTLVDDMEEADALVVNSCTVKSPSQDTALNITASARKMGKPVVLAGCVPSGDSSVADRLQDVSMLSVTQLDRVVEVVEEALRGNVVRLLGKSRVLPSLELPKVRRNKCIEIIPISGGCLGNCAYCKTKHARGKLSSYTEEVILKRALQAAAEGASEVWLTSEDTGAYGLDIGTHIANLLNRVADALPSGMMLKLGMTNPPYMLAHIDAVAAVMNRPNVFAFIHIPIQSGSDQVLQSMVREYDSTDVRRLVNGLREKVPELLVATDIICGFPTEGEVDHQASLDLVKEFLFPVLNISQFYPRPGTPAARMKRLPGDIAKKRSTEMAQLFASYETFGNLVGREEKVFFSDTEAKRGQTVGHTKGYAKVVVDRNDDLLGRSAVVKIERATKWHVEGQILGDKSS